jgi:Kef-type K+ transport system membrane component KefB
MRKLYLLLLIGNTYAVTTSSEVTQPVSRILLLGLLVIAALFSLIAHKYRQSTVLSQLIIGALIGILAHFHIAFFAEILNNDGLGLIAQLGSIFLLFEIGLESDSREIRHAGKYGLQVAIIGAIIPFCLGYFVVTPYVIGSGSHNLALFVGGILAVTSTSISVSIFKEFGIIRQMACQIVLTASVIDDIIGLVLLSVIAATISLSHVDGHLLLLISTKVTVFFITCYIFAKFILPKILIPQLSKLGTGENTVTLFIVAICFSMSWFAETIGLAGIVGAFFAGLMLKSNNFHNHELLSKPKHKEYNKSLIDLILPLGRILTPIFFIYAGMQVDLVNVFNLKTIIIAVLISIVAIIGKLLCAITLPRRINRLMVGFGMVPRGEIGIIFAITGLNIGVIDNNLFTTLLLVIVLTSIITPIALNTLIRKQEKDRHETLLVSRDDKY